MIRDVREAIVKEIESGSPPWSVYSTKPDDVNDVPCVVVDRPTITLNVQQMTFEVPVIVIGRRDGSADAQVELDEVAMLIVGLVQGPDFAVLRVQPAAATIAELTYPAYELTVSCGASSC